MTYRTLNPATEEFLKEFPVHTESEVSEKIRIARQAFASWKQTPLAARIKRLRQFADLLKSQAFSCASLMTVEMGKPITEAEHEIGKCLLGLDYFLSQAPRILEPAEFQTAARKSYVRYDPLGVIFGIMPWNFPFWQVLRFAIPALLAGNTILLKHAPNVPQSALKLESLFHEAGCGDVFQNLFVDNETAARWIASDSIAGVSLTGSSRAGSAVAETAGKALKKTVLELGGSDAFIVLADADISKAASVAVQSRMINAGQSCIAAKRWIVHEKVADAFQTACLKFISEIKVGDPKDPATTLGPLARRDLLENLERQVKEMQKQGARLEVGGKRVGSRGFFYAPTLLSGVTMEMLPFQEEVFGPVASLIRVRSEDEAVFLANQTSYGLGASLWTRDLERAEALASQIEAGSVFINALVKSDPSVPFGGIKKSGYGRELSEIGMHEFTNIKTVWVGT